MIVSPIFTFPFSLFLSFSLSFSLPFFLSPFLSFPPFFHNFIFASFFISVISFFYSYPPPYLFLSFLFPSLFLSSFFPLYFLLSFHFSHLFRPFKPKSGFWMITSFFLSSLTLLLFFFLSFLLSEKNHLFPVRMITFLFQEMEWKSERNMKEKVREIWRRKWEKYEGESEWGKIYPENFCARSQCLLSITTPSFCCLFNHNPSLSILSPFFYFSFYLSSISLFFLWNSIFSNSWLILGIFPFSFPWFFSTSRSLTLFTLLELEWCIFSFFLHPFLFTSCHKYQVREKEKERERKEKVEEVWLKPETFFFRGKNFLLFSSFLALSSSIFFLHLFSFLLV